MQWKTHDERQICTNPWVNLCLSTSSNRMDAGGRTTSFGSGTWPWPPWSMIAERS